MIEGTLAGVRVEFPSFAALARGGWDLLTLTLEVEDLPSGFVWPPAVQVVTLFRCRGVDDAMRLPPTVRSFVVRETMLSRCNHLIDRRNIALEEVVVNTGVLESLEADWPDGLVTLDVTGNRLRRIPARYPDAMRRLSIGDNYELRAPGEFYPPGLWVSCVGIEEVEEEVERREVRAATLGRPVRRGLAQHTHTSDDNQNVHMTSVQTSLADSIRVIMDQPAWHASPRRSGCLGRRKPCSLESDILQTLKRCGVHKERVEVVEAALANSMASRLVHSRHGVTYAQLMAHVWGVVTREEDCELDRARILGDELYDGARLCFTGQITRLANSLCGILDGVSVQISGNEQIGNYISAALQKLDPDDAQYEARAEAAVRGVLHDLEVDPKDWAKWLAGI